MHWKWEWQDLKEGKNEKKNDKWKYTKERKLKREWDPWCERYKRLPQKDSEWGMYLSTNAYSLMKA